MGEFRKLVIPNAARVGPMPRTRRFLPLPSTTKPTISESAPGPEMARAEKFTMRLERIVMVNVAVVEPEPFVAVIVTVKVPHVVGVPVITPVVELIVRPGGSPVAE